MKSKKLMHIQDCFINLPDDFNGTLLDALKLLVQFREEAETKNNVARHEEEDNLTYLWANDNIKVTMSYGFAELDDSGTDWIYDTEWINNIIGEKE